MANKIDMFRNDYYFLSNMYPCDVVYGGVLYTCAEAAFQAAKCPARAKEFVGLDGKAAKRLGRKVPLRPDWDGQRLRVMREILAAKFGQNPGLDSKLAATGDAELVEGNTWNDRFWGVCDGTGENHLGKLLMERRSSPKNFPRASAEKGMARLQELWAARKDGTATITVPLPARGVAFDLAPVFPAGADEGRIGNAIWVSVYGPLVANAIEDAPAGVADRLANYDNVLRDHDRDLAFCLRHARRHAGKPFQSQEFSIYSDWYKSLIGIRPAHWDSLEKILTGLED